MFLEFAQRISDLMFQYFLLMLISSWVMAEPNAELCLTQEKRTNKENILNDTAVLRRKPVTVNFSAGGKSYRLISGRDIPGPYIELFADRGKRLSTITARQPVGWLHEGKIVDFKLTKTGWLWIDGEYYDYLARVDLDTTPVAISEPIEISTLVDIPCLLPPFIGCGRANGVYSEVLQRVFVSSTKDTLFHVFSPVSLQIIDGVGKPFPAGLDHLFRVDQDKQEIYFHDLPLQQGVLFRDAVSGEALFYDGSAVTSLLDAKIYGKRPAIHGEKTLWHLKMAPFSKRVFLIVDYSDKNILLEIKKNLDLTPVYLPENMADDTFNLMDLPGLSTLVWKGGRKNALYIEVDAKLRTIIKAKSPLRLGRTEYFGNPPDDGISIDVINTITNEKNNYSIVRNMPSKRCMAMLDPDSPVVFSVEQ